MTQRFIEGNGSESGGVIGHAMGNDQFAVVERRRYKRRSARSLMLLLVRFEQGFAETADHFAGIIVIEKERADAARSQGADTVAEDFGLHGGTAVPKLDQLPREQRVKKHLAFMPEVKKIKNEKE